MRISQRCGSARVFLREAVVLQTQAVKHAAKNDVYAKQLEAYQSLGRAEGILVDAQPSVQGIEPNSEKLCVAHPSEKVTDDFTRQLATLHWQSLGDQLTQTGGVLIPGVVDPEAGTWLRGRFDEEALFAKTRGHGSTGLWSWHLPVFPAPVPDLVNSLRKPSTLTLPKSPTAGANRWANRIAIRRHGKASAINAEPRGRTRRLLF